MTDSIFGGLPDNIFLVSSFSLVRYVLFLGMFSGISGYVAVHMIQDRKLFEVFRFGWKDWYRRGLRKSLLLISAVSFPFLLISYWHHQEAAILYAFCIFLCHMLFTGAVQVTLILMKGNAWMPFSIIMVIQIASVLFSCLLPDGWKILLPGNWGCINRSSLVLEKGFSLPAVVIMEWTGLLCFWKMGWKLVRKSNRG